MVRVGLYIQHGSQRCSGHTAEPDVEFLQYWKIQGVRTAVGYVAGFGSGMDYIGNELGTLGLPASVGLLGCPQFVASGNCWPNNDIL